jgi:hypothetical protein
LGEISVALKIKSPEGKSNIKAQLDSIGKSHDVSVNQTSDYVTIPVGSFSIKGAHYHCLQINGISKTGKYFPDIESIVISGPARLLLF